MMRLGIPVIELTQEKPIGIFFLVHGHFGEKSLNQFGGLAEKLHTLGFEVVTLDAYKHGERKQEPYLSNDPVMTTIEMVKVIDETIKDIVYLYRNHYNNKSSLVSVLGISMGGHISFLLNRHLDLQFCIPIIGSPNLKYHYETKKKMILGPKLEQIQDDLKRLTLQPQEFKPKHALILEGELDSVVSYEPAKQFVESLSDSHYLYKGYLCGHELTESMKDDIIQFVRSKL